MMNGVVPVQITEETMALQVQRAYDGAAPATKRVYDRVGGYGGDNLILRALVFRAVSRINNM